MQSAVNIQISNRVSLPNVDIPEGLVDLLQQFTIAVLRERPLDLVQFASTYFGKMQRETRGRGLREEEEDEQEAEASMNAEASPSPTDERVDDDDDEETDMMPPTFSASLAGRRKSVAAESFDPDAEVDEADLQRVSVRGVWRRA